MRPKLLVLAAIVFIPLSRLSAQQDTLRREPPKMAMRGDTLRLSADSVRWMPWTDPRRAGSSVNRAEFAQDPGAAFAQHLFPPELVMQHQARLKITEAQRNVIVAEISKLQATAVQVQWRVGDESEKLAELLQRETVAEADVLAQADRMIMYETAVKRAQLSMLIRIRNTLTPEQRVMLKVLRGVSRE